MKEKERERERERENDEETERKREKKLKSVAKQRTSQEKGEATCKYKKDRNIEKRGNGETKINKKNNKREEKKEKNRD